MKRALQWLEQIRFGRASRLRECLRPVFDVSRHALEQASVAGKEKRPQHQSEKEEAVSRISLPVTDLFYYPPDHSRPHRFGKRARRGEVPPALSARRQAL